ncbi:MAG TPA: biopolymer transporter ExbD [Chthoniobacteraceae bacterium]|jgi:biopolymer transport protein ExbD|nr:biopolymer transporter ExbD [Chthoniobacteraceae bacterium]
MAGGGGGGEGEPEFQIAPMIDVLLVLLIFFMSITTTQVLKVDKSIQLPLAPDAIKKDTQRSEVIVNVRWNKVNKKPSYVVDDRVFLETGELTKAVTEAKKIGETRVAKSANPTFRVVIRGDRDVPATYIARAMNAAAESGISDISFSAVNKD